MKLVGIFGGAFDPPHLGHAFIIRSLLKTLPLDEIRVVPTGIPPHRSPPSASPSHRYKMTSRMIAPISRVSVDAWETTREGPCYTVDTLSQFRVYFGPTVSLALVVGIDAFSLFPKWHLPRKILKLAHVIVIPRAGIKVGDAKRSVRETLMTLGIDLKKHIISDPKKLTDPIKLGVYVSGIIPPDISSTLVRQLLLQGGDAKPFLPKEVWEYIKCNHLYRGNSTHANP